jgi:hypothetical protein
MLKNWSGRRDSNPSAKRLAAKRNKGIEGSGPVGASPECSRKSVGKTGAGEGIRTLDPNLGKIQVIHNRLKLQDKITVISIRI